MKPAAPVTKSLGVLIDNPRIDSKFALFKLKEHQKSAAPKVLIGSNGQVYSKDFVGKVPQKTKILIHYQS